MFGNLIDTVNADMWQVLDIAAKVQSEWAECQVNRNVTRSDETTLVYQVYPQNPEGDLQSVQLKDCLPKENPLKEIHVVELKIKDKEIVGIDLDGEIIVRK